MAKHKSPSELATRVIRINVDTYLVLKGLSRRAGVSMADALQKLITGQLKPAKPEPEPEPEPIVVPVTQSTFIVKSPVAFQARPQPIIVTNGHKAGILVIKPKGGVIND